VLPFKIEPMTLADAPAVMALERIAFSTGWPMGHYEYELQHNTLAHYLVLRTSFPSPLHPAASTASENLKIGPDDFSSEPFPLVGIGGFWLGVDEANINIIAIHPLWRGLGWGEWLLLSLIELGQSLGAITITLEVRPFNAPALALYQKYQFQEVGRRLHFYDDNNEDALILTTPGLTLPDYQAMLSQRKLELLQRWANIEK
jgi:[ribosomal protein S18]-alanine N-acetyltransferase